MAADPMPPEALRTALAAAARDVGADLAVLFGSRAEGVSRPGADADVALAFGCLPPPDERLRILGRLQDAAGAAPVDVVFLHRDTDPVLRFEVFRVGIVLHESEPGAFVHARVHAAMLYDDAAPFRRALRRQLRGEFGQNRVS